MNEDDKTEDALVGKKSFNIENGILKADTLRFATTAGKNIWNLAPYSCARTEFAGRNARVFLDANENPYNDPYNRYPDPLQVELKVPLSSRHNPFFQLQSCQRIP